MPESKDSDHLGMGRRRHAQTPKVFEPQTIGDDEQARKAHRSRREHRIEQHVEERIQNARRNWDQRDVVSIRPKEVQTNDPERPSRKL